MARSTRSIFNLVFKASRYLCYQHMQARRICHHRQNILLPNEAARRLCREEALLFLDSFTRNSSSNHTQGTKDTLNSHPGHIILMLSRLNMLNTRLIRNSRTTYHPPQGVLPQSIRLPTTRSTCHTPKVHLSTSQDNLRPLTPGSLHSQDSLIICILRLRT
jgi:hypothetical protein